MTHRHEASYMFGLSSGFDMNNLDRDEHGKAYGWEHGTCTCGAAVMRRIREGDTGWNNSREWVTRPVSLVHPPRRPRVSRATVARAVATLDAAPAALLVRHSVTLHAIYERSAYCADGWEKDEDYARYANEGGPGHYRTLEG